MKQSTPVVFLGADHAGFALKQQIKPLLAEMGFAVVDKGAKKFIPADDYPDYAYAVAKEIGKGRGLGVLLCGSSHGVCIAANKVRGVRAASVTTVRDAELTREHNDANVLCLSGWGLPLTHARAIVRAFLTTPYSGATRHERRLKKITAFEKKIFRR